MSFDTTSEKTNEHLRYLGLKRVAIILVYNSLWRPSFKMTLSIYTISLHAATLTNANNIADFIFNYYNLHSNIDLKDWVLKIKRKCVAACVLVIIIMSSNDSSGEDNLPDLDDLKSQLDDNPVVSLFFSLMLLVFAFWLRRLIIDTSQTTTQEGHPSWSI